MAPIIAHTRFPCRARARIILDLRVAGPWLSSFFVMDTLAEKVIEAT